jgi:hypothetical protein
MWGLLRLPYVLPAGRSKIRINQTKLSGAGWTTETSVTTKLLSGSTTSMSPCSNDALKMHARGGTISGLTAITTQHDGQWGAELQEAGHGTILCSLCSHCRPWRGLQGEGGAVASRHHRGI